MSKRQTTICALRSKYLRLSTRWNFDQKNINLRSNYRFSAILRNKSYNTMKIQRKKFDQSSIFVMSRPKIREKKKLEICIILVILNSKKWNYNFGRVPRKNNNYLNLNEMYVTVSFFFIFQIKEISRKHQHLLTNNLLDTNCDIIKAISSSSRI